MFEILGSLCSLIFQLIFNITFVCRETKLTVVYSETSQQRTPQQRKFAYKEIIISHYVRLYFLALLLL